MTAIANEGTVTRSSGRATTGRRTARRRPQIGAHIFLLVLVVYFLMRPTRRGLWVPTGLLLGGALGNLIDRLAQGYVTDFIKLPAWPAFNISDMAITFGVLSLLYVLESGGDDGGADSKRG